ncbi:ankyrin repeat-containing domain protein [Aspergillus keveii]|uniref:Ankyrin repeat-containing domain protein n=1 Tax=Aspergillus keveii TaxID=714993 RepID=A0ABR4FJH5_9EURO
MDDSVWESYKPELHRLYIRQSLKLSEVIDYMTAKYAFEATKGQYIKYFSRWGFQKNQHISASDGVFIGRRIEKRKRQFDKESEVHIHGKEYAARKVQKAPYGKAYVSAVDGLRVPGAPSPDTPEGIVVCTPASPGMRLNFNKSLPWLRFSRLLQPGRVEDLPSPTARLAVSSPQHPLAVRYTMDRELLARLNSIVPWDRLSAPADVASTSRTATGLSILMPEECEGQHRAMAARFSESKQSTVDSFGMEMFLLSNNLISHGPKGKSSDSMLAHDRRVLKMFQDSGWNSVTQLQALLSIKEPTAAAIVEKLFGSALRTTDEDIVRMLLDAGVHPNCPIDTVDHGALTPLQFLSTLPWDDYDPDLADLAKLLLSHGAGVDTSYNGTSPLEYAVDIVNEPAIALFLSQGARATPSCLAAAAANIEDVSIFSSLLDADTDVNLRSGIQERSPLARAVAHDNTEVIKLLLHRGADVNALADIDYADDWALTTVLGLAAQSAKWETIAALVNCGQDINPVFDGLPFISPLALAVARPKANPGTVELLLHAGIDVRFGDTCGKRSLLELAFTRKNPGICDLLVRYGAMVERPMSAEEQTTSPLLCAVRAGAIEFATSLIYMGVRANDVYSEPPGTVLGAAIEGGHLSLVQTLLAAGARCIYARLTKIGNLETAVYLEGIGILPQILSVSGVQIMGTAVAAEKYDLAERLLHHNLDLTTPIVVETQFSSEEALTTPLCAAISRRQIPFAYTLLEYGSRVTDAELRQAVQYAHKTEVGDADADAIQLLRRLLVPFRGAAPMACAEAILRERPDIVEMLFCAGVDPGGRLEDIWDLDEDTEYRVEGPQSVLELAARTGNTAVLKLLLRARPWEPRLVGRALLLAILFHRADLVAKLFEVPIDVHQEVTVDHLDVDGPDGKTVPGYDEVLTALQVAAKEQQVAAVKALLAHGPMDVNYLGKGVRRRTALQHAVESGNMELVNLLIAHDANINADPAADGGATALQIAAIRGYIGIARRLIDLRADVNAPPARYNGRTALEGAAEHGRIDMLQMLLDEGAKMAGEFGQRQYKRAIDFAEKNGHYAAARLLINFEPQHG